MGLECRYHPGEETCEQCKLCWTPMCLECLDMALSVGYSQVCPKCLRALGIEFEDIIIPPRGRISDQ